ncbi:hypothetical protein B0H65DRAFT_509474 [Neurospora tetraspora]|uniref:Oxidoreductase acuF-like C2H2 type zinc-finger domain-containing protein n=1 Tax=Neurospora tetraspora TaxID=94610 RepID=A0AAE0JCL6_9PEZI|nr:hypothetical protein B0H65DRAFT_509474 [Neurospora tetraspora]
MAPEEKISLLVLRGISTLKSLIETFENGIETEEESIALASSHLERFRLWVGSLGAHRESGSRSLEYKLRDASLIRKHIVTLLQDLCSSVDQALSVTSTAGISLDDKEQPNDDKDIDDKLAELFYGGDKDAIHRPELDQALGRIGHAVDCLLRLSATIRHPAPHDQFKSRAGAELIEAFRALDKDHIRHKFVQLDEPLVDRLGKSMAMRRHYFKYREEHANRIARGLEEVEQGLKCDASEYTTTKTAISSLPGHLKDNKAIYTSTETSTTACADEFTDFDDMRSQTSYAPTEANSSELRVPRIPPEYVDGPFKCPYCHMIIVIETRHEWKKHIFRDLQPYTCLAKTCTIPNQQFSRRSEWVTHMEREHWRVWHCSLGCTDASFDNLEEFLEHNQSAHGGELASSGLRSQSNIHASSVRDKSKARGQCPLCPEVQLDLALFASPRVDDDYMYTTRDDSDEDQNEQDLAKESDEEDMEEDELDTSADTAYHVELEVPSEDGDIDGRYIEGEDPGGSGLSDGILDEITTYAGEAQRLQPREEEQPSESINVRDQQTRTIQDKPPDGDDDGSSSGAETRDTYQQFMDHLKSQSSSDPKLNDPLERAKLYMQSKGKLLPERHLFPSAPSMASSVETGFAASPANQPQLNAMAGIDTVIQNNAPHAENYGNGWEGGDNKREQQAGNLLEGDNMFSDLGEDVFEGNELTDADFDFFDEQLNEQPEGVEINLGAIPELGTAMDLSADTGQPTNSAPQTNNRVEEYKTNTQPAQ